MSVSKPWDWQIVDDPYWLMPCEEVYYLAARWREKGFHSLLDFGCGLGRHSIFFAQNGFDVSAFDLSPDGVAHLAEWAKRDGLSIDTRQADMLNLPYPDRSFDCLFAYHVISHTDAVGMQTILSEIKRVLKPQGEFYITFRSKSSWPAHEKKYPRIDDYTLLHTDDGPEKDVPHFYVDLDDIFALLKEFTVLKVRHTDDCYQRNDHPHGFHYFILGGNTAE